MLRATEMVNDVKIHSDEMVRGLRKPPDKDEQLKKACREFESVFTYEMLKSMRSTVDKCDLFHGGQGEEIYESLLDQELSKKLAGLGPQSIANVLYRKFHREGVDQAAPEESGIQNLPDHQDTVPLDPLSVGPLSSAFGWRKDPFTGEDQFHQGIDLAAPAGTPVRAPQEGKVMMSGFREGYGNVVVLDHGAGLTTLYAHNQENKVKAGDWVRKGGVVATVGSTGRSTGPHLHFEMRKNGIRQDPRALVTASQPKVLGSTR